jgi:hypothetical protein
MFCNQCGSTIVPGTTLCPACGRPALAAAPVIPGPSRLERHLRTLGILWIIASSIFVIPAFILMLLGSVVHFSIPGTEQVARILGPFVLFLIGSIFLLISACGIFLGWGLMKHYSWARIAGIILGVIVLFHPILGTALGIYTLWVLLSDDGKQYQRLAAAST